jgi:P27 family predicted phage terminase small subunit
MAGQGGARVGAGKKKTPDHLKLVKGTFRKDRVKKDAPSPSKKLAVAPSHLNDRAVYYFNLIVNRMDGRASDTFTEIISSLAIRLEECERYYSIIYETPFFQTVDGFGNKVLKNHPLSTQYKEAMRHSHTLLGEVGLTPASISRMGGGKKEETKDPWDEL